MAEIISQLGQGSLLAKVDIEAAYRLIPVHPHDRSLQAVRWENQIYIDPMLPFGLRSAPKIFNAVADVLHWYLRKAGIRYIEHYLDDFIIVAPPHSQLCQHHLTLLLQVCRHLGVPIAAHKTEGPSTQLTFLGIEIDTEEGQLRLPADKLSRLLSTLQEWENRKWCIRKDLESLIGLLNHACKVVRSGRSFLRRMIDLLHSVNHHPNSRTPIRLNVGFRSDLAWWLMFLQGWNGISFLWPPSKLPCQHLTSDASGSWGCGAWHGDEWFQLQWRADSAHLSIAEKEMIPIILACAAWGSAWGNHQITCFCDNQVMIACLKSRTSKAKGLMHLLWCLVFIEAHFHCYLIPTYIDTHANHLADDLSRDNLSSFLSKVPTAKHDPTPISEALLALLLDTKGDWISLTWRQQFNGIFS